MKFKLNEQELKYLTIIVEQNLEKNWDRKEINMLHDLYSKLVVLKEKTITERITKTK